MVEKYKLGEDVVGGWTEGENGVLGEDGEDEAQNG